jgi:cytoskeletal protein CcmA (bactofilin family)
MKHYCVIAMVAFAGPVFATAQDISQVGGPITVTAGQPVGNVSNVNGPIRLDDKAIVLNAHSVNGGITLGAAASAQSVSTVNGGITLEAAASVQSLRTNNGSISIGPGARVAGTVTSINGTIALEHSANISGHLSTANGKIYLDAAHVGGGIETVTSSIEIGPGSRVEGGILIMCTKGAWDWLLRRPCPPPLVVIGPDAIVQGTLTLEQNVRLYVSDRARIGPVEGVKAIIYSGERPPI